MSQISSSNFKIINTSIDYNEYILSSKLFKMNSLIGKSEFSQQFSLFHILLLLLLPYFFFFIYLPTYLF